MVCVVKLSIAYSGLKTDSRRGRGSYDSLSTLYRKGELSPKTICIGEFGSTRKKLYLPCTENESWVLKQSVEANWVPLEKGHIGGLSPVRKIMGELGPTKQNYIGGLGHIPVQRALLYYHPLQFNALSIFCADSLGH